MVRAVYVKNRFKGQNTRNTDNVCPRSLDPFDISYNIKWVMTYWSYITRGGGELDD